MSSPDRARFEWECRQVEAELTHIGGYELLVDARTEATWHANLYVPWDGHGDEPLERLRTRLDILTLRLDRARGTNDELA